ncbi:response regulator [Mesorhizobium sp. AA22]|uniref:response regulator n=1 Tax=Mesorhizobium sp. AA22 TaxID=1854057 RepID=UPI0012EA435F|nr:response regulator [Mesorhizobium sp. AA22]QIA21502.1 response regulator [Mesorhizobium sp. AA22]
MKKPVVLVADDEPLITINLEVVLCEAGFTVVLAASCEEAQAWLSDERPDMAVLEVRLKDRECVSLAERLVLLGVPFVVHSGVLPADCDVAFAYGKFIAKPGDPQEIVDLIKSMVAG